MATAPTDPASFIHTSPIEIRGQDQGSASKDTSSKRVHVGIGMRANMFIDYHLLEHET